MKIRLNQEMHYIVTNATRVTEEIRRYATLKDLDGQYWAQPGNERMSQDRIAYVYKDSKRYAINCRLATHNERSIMSGFDGRVSCADMWHIYEAVIA